MNATKITSGMDTKGKLSGSDHGSLVADPTEGESTMNSPKRLARIAGVLYLLVIGVKTVKPAARRPASVAARATD